MSVVRIVVLRHGRGSGPRSGLDFPSSRDSTSSTSSNDRLPAAKSLPAGSHHATDPTLDALRRLGDEAVIHPVTSVEACLASLSEHEIALIVLDLERERDTLDALEWIGEAGPPIVVVTRDDSDETALEAFRRGAADCVRVSDDYAQVLPAVALEQIRRWRQKQEKGAAERRIRLLEHLRDAIVSEIPAGLAVLDTEGGIVTINPECSRLLGVSAEEANGHSLPSVFPADLLQSGGIPDLVQQTARGEMTAPRIAHSVGRDGDTRIYDVRSQRLDEEGRALLVLSDVTESERQAKRIGELQSYNDNIIQNINSALLVVATDGLIRFCNPTAESILGLASDELVGRRISDWFGATKGQGNLIARTLKEGVRFKGAETVITREDGRVVPIGISCSPLLDPDGEQIAAVAIFQDLSDIKQLERQVLQSEKMASIGQLAAGVAHEINNPMGFIHANLYQMTEYLEDLQRVWRQVEALQQCIAAGSPLDDIQTASRELARVSQDVDLDYVREDFGKAVRESQEGSERIRHIVSDLRDFSHQDTAEPMLSDVNQCLDSTANIVWTMMKHSVTLKKDYAELPRLRCFPMQLKQVFMNLLVNAYQAIELLGDKGGATSEIEVRSYRTAEDIIVSIRDSGIGISRDHVTRIFEPFFTTKDVGAGTGLGLSTSYSIIKRHGGEIRVESEVGKGTTFTVRLPAEGIPEPQGGTFEI